MYSEEGSEEVKASGVGEILAAADFMIFDAKYYNRIKDGDSPGLPGGTLRREDPQGGGHLRQWQLRLVRVDFS